MLQETTAYKQHSKDETSGPVPTGSNFEQGMQLPGEFSNSKEGGTGKGEEAHADQVPSSTKASVSHKRTFPKVKSSIRKITARRREELKIIRSYRTRRRKKRKVSLKTTASDRYLKCSLF